MKPTRLLDDGGTASMATGMLVIHHAFRRDLHQFAGALSAPTLERAAEVRAQWAMFHENLHGHHEKEDEGVFPMLAAQSSELAAAIKTLSAQHAKLDPLLRRGDAAFAALPETADARAVIADITALLDEHFDLEEATIVPSLREAKQWPAPPDESFAPLFAEGFGWALIGIAPDVRDKLNSILAPSIVAHLPAAREKAIATWQKAWGDVPAETSTTSIPA
jgi:hemerythrin-like domain-containing protein